MATKIMVRKRLAADAKGANASATRESSGGSAIQKALGNRKLLLSLAVVVAIILAVTWPSRFGDAIKTKVFDRSLEKLDACKGEADQAAKNNCYRDLAFSTNKTYFCHKVLNSSRIAETCFAKLAIDANSKKACEQLRDAKVRGFCLRELAVNKAELPLCGNIDDKFWKNSCYSQLAIVLKKPDPCSLIEEPAESADCYLTLAKNISSGPACAYISDQAKKDECFLAVGVASSDQLLCAEIVEPANRWTCYHRIAKDTGNAKLCDRVPTVFRKSCVDAVKNAASVQ